VVNFGDLIWTPSEDIIKNSNVVKFIDYLNSKGHRFEVDYSNPIKNIEYYNNLWKFSVENFEEFWKIIWEYFNIKSNYTKVLEYKKMPWVKWFLGSKLNYVEYLLRNTRGSEDAIIYIREDNFRKRISWLEFENKVQSFANWLKKVGIYENDRIVAYISQVPEGVIALAATSYIGAIFSVAGAELAVRAVIERFKQLEPKVLIAVDGYIHNGKEFSKINDILELVKSIPSISRVIIIPNLGLKVPDLGKPTYLWDEVTKERAPQDFRPLKVNFDRPLWILYTSGTTGIPKPIVHGHGGIVLEGLKLGHIHLDLKPNDKFLWYSTPSWMVWNVVVNGLLSGATIVFYDGSPTYNNYTKIWEVTEKERISILGLSSPFIHASMKLNVEPKSYNLKSLRSIGVTAAPLSPQGYEWVYKNIKEDIWLNSVSGGTDVMTGFVGGVPILPVWAGEIQCRLLGVAVDAYNEEGKPVVNEVGELVVTKPIPSMPLYFWNDPEFKWYLESYFSMFPGVWRHGDWIKITERGSVIILGRSDSTIKRKGIRMGTLDIYKVVESLPEVQNSLAVEVKEKLILYVVLKPNIVLDENIKNKIKDALRNNLGPYFIPDYIIQVQDIPMTLNFKKLEVPVKKILLGWDINKAVKLETLQNPEALIKLIEASKPIIMQINH
jgi:acetoacetyl-CoA synthetase